MNVSEKAAYLKGLLEGLKIDDSTSEGKLLKEVVATICELADESAKIAKEIDTINDFLDELDYDLGAVEEDVYGDDGEDDEDFDYDDDDDDDDEFFDGEDDDEEYCDCDDNCDDCEYRDSCDEADSVGKDEE